MWNILSVLNIVIISIVEVHDGTIKATSIQGPKSCINYHQKYIF